MHFAKYVHFNGHKIRLWNLRHRVTWPSWVDMQCPWHGVGWRQALFPYKMNANLNTDGRCCVNSIQVGHMSLTLYFQRNFFYLETLCTPHTFGVVRHSLPTHILGVNYGSELSACPMHPATSKLVGIFPQSIFFYISCNSFLIASWIFHRFCAKFFRIASVGNLQKLMF